MSARILSRRQLGRATLARQLLLRRASLPVVDAVEQLGGLQAQAPLAPYVGLWSRLHGFDPAVLSAAVAQHHVVRTHAMRSTIHLLTAADAVAFRAVFHPQHRATFASSPFARRLAGIEVEAVIEVGRQLLEHKALTRPALGAALAQQFPAGDPQALAYAVTYLVPLLQPPPRGTWGIQGPARWQALEPLLGRNISTKAQPDQLVLRYLAAFGPASVADVQAWSGLTRLAEVVDRLPLVHYRTDADVPLVDLPDADLPDEDTPAPPRFLPEYDNVLLAHADRSRVIPDGRPVPLPPGNGAKLGTLLVDGVLRGTWQWDDQTVRVRAEPALTADESADVSAEADRLRELLRAPAAAAAQSRASLR